jgi:hypothetical protein
MNIVQAGSINIAALQAAGVYIQIVPPQLLINGVATNIAGLVGSAAWGPVNAPTVVGSYANYAAQFGDMVPRKYDGGTHVWNAYQQGNQVVFQFVRATDGTDTAATVTLQSTCLTLTSKFTGSRGNSQQITLGNGSAANSQRATLLTPGVLPEVFDNILQGLQALTATAGTLYTSVPALSLTAPQTAGGVQAAAGASLSVYGTPTAPGGSVGTGHAVNDFITFSNGVVLKVATVTGGVINTYAPVSTSGCSGGSITGAGTAAPTNPIAQVSTTGSGTGATATVTWGIGPAVNLVPGSGYTAAPTATLTGGGGSAGAYTATIAYWPNIAAAINSGQGSGRGPSQFFVATNGTGTAAPTAGTTALAGGTDGAAGVTGNTLIGVDTLPRTGMYALRGKGCSLAALADCDLSTTWTTQIAFGLYEGAYMIGTTPSGDTIANAQSEITAATIDSYAMKLMLGDWPQINDTINNIARFVSPQGFVLGVLGNLGPNQSSLNKAINGIVGTQKSQTGLSYTNADLQALALARCDVIASPSPGGAYFACQTGRNSSSNPSIRQDSYSRMTNFLSSTLAAGLGIYVGTLGTPGQARRLKSTLDAFMSNVQTAGLIGDPDNPSGPAPWKCTVDQSLISQGIEQATLQVQYQAITEVLVISVQGGQTVTLSRSVAPAGS